VNYKKALANARAFFMLKDFLHISPFVFHKFYFCWWSFNRFYIEHIKTVFQGYYYLRDCRRFTKSHQYYIGKTTHQYLSVRKICRKHNLFCLCSLFQRAPHLWNGNRLFQILHERKGKGQSNFNSISKLADYYPPFYDHSFCF